METRPASGPAQALALHVYLNRLERLAEALAHHGLRTSLMAPPGRVHSLPVVNPAASALAEDVYTGRGQDGTWWFWWSWAERIATWDDLEGAAALIKPGSRGVRIAVLVARDELPRVSLRSQGSHRNNSPPLRLTVTRVTGEPQRKPAAAPATPRGRRLSMIVVGSPRYKRLNYHDHEKAYGPRDSRSPAGLVRRARRRSDPGTRRCSRARPQHAARTPGPVARRTP